MSDKAYFAAYYQKNKEKKKAQALAWARANKARKAANGAAWNRANPEKVKASIARQKARDPQGYRERTRKIYVKTRYGLSSDAYDRLVAKHGGVCAVCRKQRKLVVDHCHTTGRVRGMICQRCNVAIGYYETSDIAAIEAYLKAQAA